MLPPCLFSGTKIEHKPFFSPIFRAPPGYPGKIPGYPAKKSLISLVSRDIPNFLAPTPSRGRPLPHRKISGLKSLGLCFFFAPDVQHFRSALVCREMLATLFFFLFVFFLLRGMFCPFQRFSFLSQRLGEARRANKILAVLVVFRLLPARKDEEGTGCGFGLAFSKGGEPKTRGNDIRVTPGMTVQ